MPVNGSIQLAYQTAAWFTANPTIVLLEGQHVYLEQTGTYKIGDGVTALSALSFLGGGSGVQSVTGPQVDDTDPFNPVVNTPNLQEVTDEGASTTNAINAPQYSTSGGEVTITTAMVEVLDSTSSSQLLYVDRTTDTVQKLGVEVATNGEGTAIASASTVDLGVDGNSLYHITGSNTIDAFTLPAGVKKTIVFDGSLIITASSDIILPGNISMVTGAGDNAIVIGEGAGVVRFLTFFKYDESYTNYTPSFTGFSVAPTITDGDWRWKMLTKNTFHLIGWGTSTGTSNSTAMTVTSPFNLAWTGGSGYGLQQSPCVVVNNGANTLGTVRSRVGNSNILDCYTAATAGFNALGGKNVFINSVFQVAL